MSRRQTKCGTCGDLLWFADDSPHIQSVVCTCQDTELTETGPTGNFVALSLAERESLTEGIHREDLTTMRTIFSSKAINGPRHCFRWNKSDRRWELSEVAPANRTLIAYREHGDWIEV